MAAVSEYARNIAIFLIFSALVEIISPSGKYRGFINLLTGLVMIIILIEPLSNVMSFFTDGSIASKQAGSYGSRESVIIAAYKNLDDQVLRNAFDEELFRQLESFMPEGYVLTQIKSTLNDDYSKIIKLDISIAKSGGKAESEDLVKNRPFIRIEPVQVSPLSGGKQENTAVEINELKNKISSFYNLSVDNIHILS